MSGQDERSEAERRLVDEWPDVLGRMTIVSRQRPTPFFRAVRAKDVDLMKGWTDFHPHDPPPEMRIDRDGRLTTQSPVECIHAFLNQTFRLEWNRGDLSHHAGKRETAVYVLTYLCHRPSLAWHLLRIFVPLLRPHLWDPQLRYRLEFTFFEHAWPAVFEFDHLVEPEVPQFISAPAAPFDCPGSLNELDEEERHAMLAYADLPTLDDPARPSTAPWNEGWFNLRWLWDDSQEPPGLHGLADFSRTQPEGDRE